MPPLIFAILGAITFGVWTIFHKLAAPHINQIFGAIIVSFTAVLVCLAVLLPRLRAVELVTNRRGIIFTCLAGGAAFLIDFFALKAYAGGLPISVGGPVIIGGSIAVAIVIGFFLGESLSLLKAIGLFSIFAGSAILASFS